MHKTRTLFYEGHSHAQPFLYKQGSQVDYAEVEGHKQIRATFLVSVSKLQYFHQMDCKRVVEQLKVLL